ncbi:MAG: hypothetical protein PHW83_11225, partial [Bacteroidales bacterium]|nr:hypothetical protein [Bacteroidales bacterium]
KLWHDDEWIDKNVAKSDQFDYSAIDALQKFTDTHPAVMLERINRINWKFDYDLSLNKTKTKDKLKRTLERLGISFGQYKNYKLLK